MMSSGEGKNLMSEWIMQEIFCNGQSLLILYTLHKPGSRHCHLASGHCTIRQRVFDCKCLTCKICFNVLNYVFILFPFNLYRFVNFNSLATILAVVSDNTIYSKVS